MKSMDTDLTLEPNLPLKQISETLLIGSAINCHAYKGQAQPFATASRRRITLGRRKKGPADPYSDTAGTLVRSTGIEVRERRPAEYLVDIARHIEQQLNFDIVIFANIKLRISESLAVSPHLKSPHELPAPGYA